MNEIITKKTNITTNNFAFISAYVRNVKYTQMSKIN